MTFVLKHQWTWLVFLVIGVVNDKFVSESNDVLWDYFVCKRCLLLFLVFSTLCVFCSSYWTKIVLSRQELKLCADGHDMSSHRVSGHQETGKEKSMSSPSVPFSLYFSLWWRLHTVVFFSRRSPLMTPFITVFRWGSKTQNSCVLLFKERQRKCEVIILVLEVKVLRRNTVILHKKEIL